MQVRPTRVDDAREIAEIHVRTWQPIGAVAGGSQLNEIRFARSAGA